MSVIKSNAYLIRCPMCRGMILSIDDHCSHCGASASDTAWIKAAQWFISRVVLPALLALTLIGFLLLAVNWTEKQRQHRAESERALREGAFP